MERIIIDPVTRIEGHLKVEVMVEKGEVKDARVAGTLFRGWEIILKGRDPRDASQITQRVCGVCPIAHATASVFALDNAFGVDKSIPDNARIIRNLILGANFLQSHILHFYHLSLLDFVDFSCLSNYEGENPDLLSLKKFLSRGELYPFLPRYEGDYRLDKETNEKLAAHYMKALEIRKKAHEISAIFGGKMPHNVGMVAGGVTSRPTSDKIVSFLWRLNEIRDFIDNCYLPDTIALARFYQDHLHMGASHNNFLSYGAFNLDSAEIDQTKRKRLFLQGFVSADSSYEPLDISQINEQLKYSWYSQEYSGLHPALEKTEIDEKKKNGYSWIKAPRYKGMPSEVGPLARIVVSFYGKNEKVTRSVESVLSQIGGKIDLLFSILGRHIARALDAKIVADHMAEWVLQLKVDEPVYTPYSLPDQAEGMGITEAPRGALGHWIKINDKVIDSYQLVVPSTWNISPRDDSDQPGPLEKALMGLKVKDSSNPFEVVRCVRSFDPCLACAVHLITPKKKELARFRVS